MYLSFVLDDKSHASAYRFLSREDVFNVSITRARHHQKVFTSFSKGSFSFKSLVFEYVDMIQTAPSSAVVKRSTEDDKFLVEVKEELNALNVKQILDDYPIADISIDLVLVNQNNQTLGIDLVSYPGKFKGVLSPEKLEVLSRVGIEVFFLPYSWWRFKRAEALEALKEFVKGNSQ